MGYHNLPPSYDAWRMTPPDDRPRRRKRFAPSTVDAPLCIEAGDVQIDATGTYDADTAELVSVTINGRTLPVHQVQSALVLICPGDDGDWSDDMDADDLARRVREAAYDAECDWADARRDM